MSAVLAWFSRMFSTCTSLVSSNIVFPAYRSRPRAEIEGNERVPVSRLNESRDEIHEELAREAGVGCVLRRLRYENDRPGLRTR